MPGAQLTGVTDGVYTGKVKIKVGPVTAEYAGTAQFSVKDETAYRAVIDARGRDSRGNGNATALISAQLEPTGASTRVSVSTDLTIAGRIAQFGSGMIKEVSAKLLGQFVTCLEDKLSAGAVSQAVVIAAGGSGAAGGAATTSAPTSAASAGNTTGAANTASDSQGTGQAAGTVTAPAAGVDGQAAATSPSAQAGAASLTAPGPEPAALDLMSVAGRAIYKRLVPVVVGLIVLAVIIYLIVR
jgi:carbon monoxide dehydrogenase subunit G